jgi:hypothetical protein
MFSNAGATLSPVPGKGAFCRTVVRQEQQTKCYLTPVPGKGTFALREVCGRCLPRTAHTCHWRRATAAEPREEVVREDSLSDIGVREKTCLSRWKHK